MVAVKIYIFLLKLRRTRFKNGVAQSAASGRKKAREKGRLNRPSSSRYEKFAARNQPLLLYIYTCVRKKRRLLPPRTLHNNRPIKSQRRPLYCVHFLLLSYATYLLTIPRSS